MFMVKTSSDNQFSYQPFYCYLLFLNMTQSFGLTTLQTRTVLGTKSLMRQGHTKQFRQIEPPPQFITLQTLSNIFRLHHRPQSLKKTKGGRYWYTDTAPTFANYIELITTIYTKMESIILQPHKPSYTCILLSLQFLTSSWCPIV